MTAGSIIVFSNGDRKMAANEEAIFSLLRRVYRAMTEEMTPASNVEEELPRVFPFLPCWCTAASFVQSTSELWKQWYCSSGKKGRLMRAINLLLP